MKAKVEAENILVLNPGSTSTKAAWFRGDRALWEDEEEHSPAELGAFKALFDQLPWRCRAVEAMARRRGLDPFGADAVVGRGGLMKPVPSGVYAVNRAMLRDLRRSRRRWEMEHASNLGAEMALRFARPGGRPSFVVDPVTTDELEPLARLSGIPGARRQSLMHALNTKAVCRWAAAKAGKPLSRCRFVVAHLGGGASVTAVRGGRMVDTTSAICGQGPFTATRAGSLPSRAVLDVAFRKGMDKDKAMRFLLTECGLKGYTGTDKLPEVEKRMRRGDAPARLAFQGLAYQASKEICGHAAVLQGRVDAVILTGGMARDRALAGLIRRRVGFLGKFLVLPGQLETRALAQGALRVLRGREKAKVYR